MHLVSVYLLHTTLGKSRNADLLAVSQNTKGTELTPIEAAQAIYASGDFPGLRRFQDPKAIDSEASLWIARAYLEKGVECG